MQASYIELQQLEKQFQGLALPAVASLTTRINSGAVMGLVGPDGAGKTTLIRMLAGLLTPTRGQIRVMGLDPIQDERQLRAILSYMPQKFGLYEDLTVLENLNLYAGLRGVIGVEREAVFARLLAFTDLSRFTGRLAGRLSGGMKQKLGLACTLVGRPKVLLLDEPGVGVDPISRRELWSMVYELADEGMLILWSTSYLDEAEQCREVLLMNQGRLIYSGAPQQLTQSIAGRSFLLKVAADAKRQVLLQALKLPEVSDCVIQGRDIRLILRSEGVADRLLRALNLPDAELIAARPRFEDAFIDLLGGNPETESQLAKVMPPTTGDRQQVMIEAQGLSKQFGHFLATDQVSFQVRRGEIFGLLGPNGAGKSTTFKMMCGLLVPSAGRALVLDLDLKTSSGRARQHLGYMAQKFSLYGNLSVEQNLLFFSGIYGLSGQVQQQKMAEMVTAFNFSSMLNQSTGSLPLGFKQRLALACALMHEPEILFLDEPTSGVDPVTRREFWLHINGMVEKGVTVMVTTHFMEEAEYCDRIGLVYRGKLIATGSPDDLKRQVVSENIPNPSMEDAFITLVKNHDQKERA